jgi:hypothetical protein
MSEPNSELHRALTANRKLLEEVERLKGIILAQSSDFVRSKTTNDDIKPEGHNDLAGRAVEHCLKLQAENEMLRKAGDEMAEHVGREWAPSWVLEDWKAAKAGTFTE